MLAVHDKLRNLAEGMQKQIDDKMNPAVGNQNYTARRARMAESIISDGIHLQEVQAVLNALADLWERGECPPHLQKITSRAAVEAVFYRNSWPQGNYPWVEADRQKFARYGVTPENIAQVNADVRALAKGAHEARNALEARKLQDEVNSLVGQIPGFFPTPPEIATRMVELACLTEHGRKILEPSAGSGNLAKAIRAAKPDAQLLCIEINPTLCEYLKAQNFTTFNRNFLDFWETTFDVIIMNPPFEHGQDIAHIRHAHALLNTGGILVSIISESPFFREDKAYREFREWLDEYSHFVYDLPQGAFKTSQTGVKTRILVMWG